MTDESISSFRSPLSAGGAVGLIEFPAGLQYDPELLEAAVAEWPRSQRWACQFYHRSWECDGTYEILETYGIGLCVYEIRGYANDVRLTSDFGYIRLLDKQTSDSLLGWSRRIAKWLASDRAVYAFCRDHEEASRLLELTARATAHP